MSNWTIFSNHGHVLVCLAHDSQTRLRDVAADVGLTERAVQKIVRDLQESGMITISKHGRRNRYHIDTKKTLRHNLEAHCTLGALVDLIINEPTAETKPATLKPAEKKALESTAIESTSPDKKPADSKPKTAKPAKPDTKNSIERRQGSLF